MKRTWLLPLTCLGFLLAAPALHADDDNPPNVLFIAIDDLRTDLGAYGDEHAVTPHLDRFAQQGRAFNRHYVQFPTCGSSRYALLAGVHASREHPVSFGNNAFNLYQQDIAPTALPQLFQDHGYETVLIGKITHTPDGHRGGQDVRENRSDNPPQTPGWDLLDTPTGHWNDAWDAFFAYGDGSGRTRGQAPPVEALNVTDHGYPDAFLADGAVGHLNRLSQQDEPFFLAVGFYKPHLPFNAPQDYWDRFDRDHLPLAEFRDTPENVDPSITLRAGGEMFGNYDHGELDPNDDDEHARTLMHGYYAATSYVDAQVGRVLEALEQLGLDENTIVVIWGDHGYHLGEHTMWGKHTLHEHSLRSAFLVRSPGLSQPGVNTDAIISTVDIYPTLADLCDLPAPDHLHGASFANLLEDPHAEGTGPALGFWRMAGHEGQTVRTDRYRFTRWTPADDPEQVVQLELYDHEQDPGETVNIVDDHPDLAEELRQMLRW